MSCGKVRLLHLKSRSQWRSKCLQMFVQKIFYEPQNILLPNLVWLCSIVIQNVVQKNWFTVFSVKVTARTFIIKIWLFLLYFWTADWFATKLGLIVQYHKPECPVEKWITAFKVKVTAKVHFVTKFGLVMQHHEPKSCGTFCYCCYL